MRFRRKRREATVTEAPEVWPDSVGDFVAAVETRIGRAPGSVDDFDPVELARFGRLDRVEQSDVFSRARAEKRRSMDEAADRKREAHEARFAGMTPFDRLVAEVRDAQSALDEAVANSDYVKMGFGSERLKAATELLLFAHEAMNP